MIALLVLAGIALFVTFCTSVVALCLSILITRDLRDVLTFTKIVATRIGVIEQLVTQSSSLLAFTSLREQKQREQQFRYPEPPSGNPPPRPPHFQETFETEDGRHSATSFRELMEKIFRDPRYKIPRPSDIQKLNDLFQQSTEPPLPPALEPPEVLDEEFDDQSDDLPDDEQEDGPDTFEDRQNGPQ